MGYFSWELADSDDSVYIGGNDEGSVYLIQPNGKEAIEEQCYDGYGSFGEVDAYNWLAENNLTPEQLKGLSKDEIRDLGIELEMGIYYEDVNDNSKYAYNFNNKILKEVKPFQGNYGTIERKYNKTPNQLILDDTWIKKPMFEILIPGSTELKYPLKFSLDENAKYEDLDRSQQCPRQGYKLEIENDFEL